jgi:protoporphyrin/coproporphyrin ferrochelatase
MGMPPGQVARAYYDRNARPAREARRKKVLIVPISFVSDHIETLQEIDILYRDRANKAGITEFFRAPSLNMHPGFIEAPANITERQVSG